MALVTLLRDGMNLVAKEFVAAQDADDPGVLILSRFAGAAAEFHAALLVNPYDPEAVGAAIERALTMSIEERRQRHAALFRVISDNDVHAWGQRFLIALEQNQVLPGTTVPFWASASNSSSPVFADAARPAQPPPDRPALTEDERAAESASHVASQ